MSLQQIQLQHTNGPAPAYAIESDSEDDEWADQPSELPPRPQRPAKPNDLSSQQKIEWEDRPAQLSYPPNSSLFVLVGDSAKLVGSGLSEDLTRASEPFLKLGKHLLVSESHKIVLSATNIPLVLQTPLARKLLSDTKPPKLVIISSYPAPMYIPPSEHYPIRYLSCSVSEAEPSRADVEAIEQCGCEHYEVPNLIRGFEAALMTQASLLGLSAKLILLPAITIPHDHSSSSIPIGQYDYSMSSHTPLPPSLLIESDELKLTLTKLMRRSGFSEWKFPHKTHLALEHWFSHALSDSRQATKKLTTASEQTGLMYM